MSDLCDEPQKRAVDAQEDFERASRDFLARYPQYRNKLLLENVIDGLSRYREGAEVGLRRKLVQLYDSADSAFYENYQLAQRLADAEQHHERELAEYRAQLLTAADAHRVQVAYLQKELLVCTQDRDSALAALQQARDGSALREAAFEREERILTQKIKDLAAYLDRERVGRLELAQKYEYLGCEYAALVEETEQAQQRKYRIIQLEAEVAELRIRAEKTEQTTYELVFSPVQSVHHVPVEVENNAESQLILNNSQHLALVSSTYIYENQQTQRASSTHSHASPQMSLRLQQTIRDQELDLGEFAYINYYLKTELEACAAAAAQKDQEITALRSTCYRAQSEIDAVKLENSYLRKVLDEVGAQ